MTGTKGSREDLIIDTVRRLCSNRRKKEWGETNWADSQDLYFILSHRNKAYLIDERDEPVMQSRRLSLPKFKKLRLQSVTSPVLGFRNHTPEHSKTIVFSSSVIHYSCFKVESKCLYSHHSISLTIIIKLFHPKLANRIKFKGEFI